MKKVFLIWCLFSSVLLVWVSCGTDKKETVTDPRSEVPGEAVTEEVAVSIQKLEKTAYPDAIIEMYSPLGNENFDEGKVPFEFNIKNYPFGEGLKNFQLRLTINGNDPISYHMPIFQREFRTGTYKAVAYLIDQEGLALKEFGNYVERDFTVGNSQPFPDSGEPFMVLNLPEDDQVYHTGEEVIIDFLLIGGGLKEDRLKFSVAINGKEQEITELAPLRVNNLPTGEHEIQVRLVRERGEELEGIFSSAKRTVTVE